MTDPARMPRAERLAALQGGTDPATALATYDALDAVPLDALRGPWRGSGLPTGHPLDGLLEATRWWGKDFGTHADDVRPLVFEDDRGTFGVDPAGVPLQAALRTPRLLHDPRLLAVVRRGLRLRLTHRPHARLRLVEHRGVVTATMVYDALPVLDHFRRVDDGTVLGAMDLRGAADPFFFVLRRV